MAYVIRNGKLQKAKKIVKLTPAQKAVLRVPTTKQSRILAKLKSELENKKAS